MSRPLLEQSAANLQRDFSLRLKSPFRSAAGGIAPSFKPDLPFAPGNRNMNIVI
jgi:hypothetical protein